VPGAPAPPETNELGDVPTEFLPWSRAVSDAYRHGRLPFRFEANGCGTPLWANPQAQAVTPTSVLFLVMPEAWASAAAAAVKLFLAAAGAFLFVRSRRASLVASAGAGLAFGFSLFFTTWMHFPHSYVHALLPWALLAVDRLARGIPGAFRGTLAVVVLLLLGGYPEGEFYVAGAAAVFFFAVLAAARPSLRDSGKRVALAAAAVLLGTGVTAAYLVPTAFAVSRGERSRMAEIASPSPPGQFSPRDFVRPPVYWQTARFWVVPEAQGNPRDGDKFGAYSFAGRSSGYAGILVLALALGALFSGRRSRELTACRVAVGALVLYLLWYPPLRALLERTPGLREIALRLTTNRAAGILVLLLALLAARQLDRLREGRGRTSARVGVAIALAAAAVAGAGYLSEEGRPALNAVRAVSFLFPLGVLILFLVLLLVRNTPGSRRAIVALALVGTAVDVLRIGVRFNPGTRPEHYFPETPEVRDLQAASRGGRFVAAEGILTGVAYLYGLEDVRAHDPVALAAYAEALASTAGYTWTEYAARVTRLEAPFLPALNLRAVLPPDGNVRAVPGLAAYFPERLVGDRDPAGVLAAMTATGADFDFTRTAFAVGESATFAGAAEVRWWKRVRPEKILVRVRAASPRLLVIAETNDGGWSAESDGAKLPTLVVDHALLGVRVPAGERTVVLRYVPPGLPEGAVISGISLALVGALGIASVRSRGRRTGPGPTASPGRSPAR
jgi:hypothetical protein